MSNARSINADLSCRDMNGLTLSSRVVTIQSPKMIPFRVCLRRDLPLLFGVGCLIEAMCFMVAELVGQRRFLFAAEGFCPVDFGF